MSHKTYAPQNPKDDSLYEANAACYKALELYYACFEIESSADPTEIAKVGMRNQSPCKFYRDMYVQNCGHSLVKYFDGVYCRKNRSPEKKPLNDRKTTSQPFSFESTSKNPTTT